MSTCYCSFGILNYLVASIDYWQKHNMNNDFKRHNLEIKKKGWKAVSSDTLHKSADIWARLMTMSRIYKIWYLYSKAYFLQELVISFSLLFAWFCLLLIYILVEKYGQMVKSLWLKVKKSQKKKKPAGCNEIKQGRTFVWWKIKWMSADTFCILSN